jgi:hypothetical protein
LIRSLSSNFCILALDMPQVKDSSLAKIWNVKTWPFCEYIFRLQSNNQT